MSSPLESKVKQMIITSDCGNASFNSYLTGLHEISEVEANVIVTGLFGHTNTPWRPLVVSRQEVEASDCNTLSLNYNWENEEETNEDITVPIEARRDDHRQYSLQLMRGIFHMFGNVNFEFSKGRVDGEIHIIFRISHLNGKPFYWGNLSSTFPLIKPDGIK